MDNNIFHLNITGIQEHNDSGRVFEGTLKYVDNSNSQSVNVDVVVKISKEAIVIYNTTKKLHEKICERLRQLDLKNGNSYIIEIIHE